MGKLPLMLLRVYLFLFFAASLTVELQAQKYLVLDRYGTKKIRIYPGEEVVFKLKGQKKKQRAKLTQLQDSVVVLAGDVYLKLDDFDSFYFDRSGLRVLRGSSWLLVGGFMIAAAVEPLVSEPFYDRTESVVIGLGILAVAQSTRLYQWKRFKLNRRSRIWIGDTSGSP